MRALWYDIFKDGKTIADAPPDILTEETAVAWKSTTESTHTRFFNIIKDEGDKDNSKDIIGAAVHLTGFQDYASLLEFPKTVPWIVHGFADGGIVPFRNFVSVQKLFHQDGKYAGLSLVQRIRTFDSDPTITWYVVMSAKDGVLNEYDTAYGLDDAIQSFRLLKSGIAEEVFDLEAPKQGKFLRIKANDKAEITHYLNEFASVREEAVDLLVLRVASTCVWDIAYF